MRQMNDLNGSIALFLEKYQSNTSSFYQITG